MRRIRSPCCPRATSGHVAAAPPTNAMNSRRLIAAPEAQDVDNRIPPTEALEEVPMFVSGQNLPKLHVRVRSAFALITTKSRTSFDVSSGPKPAVSGCSKNPLSKASLFDHLIGAGEERRRNVEPQNSRGGQVDEEVELGRLNNRQVSRLLTAEDAPHIDAGQSKGLR
jgi:hypothetical protein